MARENNRAPAGTYAKAALVLGDLGDARAVPVLLEKLRYKDPDPLPGTAGSSPTWSASSRQCAGAPARQGRRRADSSRWCRPDPQDFDLVSFCSEALVWIGDRARQGDDEARRVRRRALRLVVAQAAHCSQTSPPPAVRRAGRPGAQAPPAQCAREVEALQIGEAKDKACELVAASSRDRRSRSRRRTPARTPLRAGWTS